MLFFFFSPLFAIWLFPPSINTTERKSKLANKPKPPNIRHMINAYFYLFFFAIASFCMFMYPYHNFLCQVKAKTISKLHYTYFKEPNTFTFSSCKKKKKKKSTRTKKKTYSKLLFFSFIY